MTLEEAPAAAARPPGACARRVEPRRRARARRAGCSRGSRSPRSVWSSSPPKARWRSTCSWRRGFGVFLDLKLHDIPTTVGRAARRIGALGVSCATVHAAGGEEMLPAAVEGFEEGWATAVDSGQPAPAVAAGRDPGGDSADERPGRHDRDPRCPGVAGGEDGLSRSGLRGGGSRRRPEAGTWTRHGRSGDSLHGIVTQTTRPGRQRRRRRSPPAPISS